MKNLKLKLIAFLILIIGISTACSVDGNENSCFSSVYTEPTSVAGPASTTVNTPTVFTVSYIPLGTCGKFNRFAIADVDTTTKEIKILVDYDGCTCPSTTTVLTEPYTFTATTAGTYTLKFPTANATTPIIKTVTVTQ